MYKLSKRSLTNLQGVNTNLVNVVQRAIEIAKQDFMVTEGLRSREQCCINYGKGRTAQQCTQKGVPAKYAQPNISKVTWLNNPFASKHSQGRAVDLVPYPVDWNDLAKFRLIAEAMKQAAKELNVSINWGGDWQKTKDYPHFEV
ncbi:endolysin [Snodgrassella alvi]|uniref:M15 family metallopeptidase n=1 Tax=Snodgrassella alvi TaxID=1196083 RepID=UPI000C1F2057|nr:M15 family metallopeptidase [Snodgrassella alvi]PIT38045.1 endolysin [Snodgrassella alvi]PIT41882.1 endolysin [Snodgrassella alvi]